MALFISFIFLLFSAYATAQLCEQCDTSKAAFFTTDSGLSSGACGYGALALKMYGGHAAAARLNIYEDGQGCGACYKIRCENIAVCSKTGTNIVVTDIHKAPTNETDFVLSNRAFRAMALPGKDKQLLGLGIVDVEYKRVPCVYKGQNLAIQVEAYSKPPNYLAIKILYQGGQTRILGAEVIAANTSTWVSMSHNYGAVYDTSKAPTGSLQFRFIIASGFDAQYFYTNEQILPAKWMPGAVYNSNVQISNIAIEKCKACKGFKQ
ncbi:expansin-like A2 [Silene latifolia]|uniref:expansin-like A2 n=1 Tax=Silene latifolia TaxID=37657 RepID=UPI003D76BEE8